MLLLIFSFSIPTNDNKFFKFATIMEIFKNYYGFFFNNLLMLQASLVAQLSPALSDPMDCSPPGSSIHGDSPGKNTGVGCHFLLQGNLPTPGIEPRSPALQADSLLSEPPEKECVCVYTSF